MSLQIRSIDRSQSEVLELADGVKEALSVHASVVDPKNLDEEHETVIRFARGRIGA